MMLLDLSLENYRKLSKMEESFRPNEFGMLGSATVCDILVNFISSISNLGLVIFIATECLIMCQVLILTLHIYIFIQIFT